MGTACKCARQWRARSSGADQHTGKRHDHPLFPVVFSSCESCWLTRASRLSSCRRIFSTGRRSVPAVFSHSSFNVDRGYKNGTTGWGPKNLQAAPGGSEIAQSAELPQHPLAIVLGAGNHRASTLVICGVPFCYLLSKEVGVGRQRAA